MFTQAILLFRQKHGVPRSDLSDYLNSQPKTSCLVLWDSWEEGDSIFSLPRYLAAHLIQIRDEHAAWAYELGKTPVLGKTVQEHLLVRDTLSMWWLSLLYERHPKMTPALYPIYMLRAFERLLEEQGISSVVALGCDQTLTAVLADFCARTKRHFESGPQEQRDAAETTSLTRRMYEWLPATLRAGIRFIVWLFTVRRTVGTARPAPAPHETACIATYYPNIDVSKAKEGRLHSRYFESLHTLLNQHAQPQGTHVVRWLFIRFPSPDLDLATLCAFRDAFLRTGRDGISFAYLEEYLTAADIVSCLRQYFALRRSAKRIENALAPHFHFASSQINFFAYARKDFCESFWGWRGLERLLQLQGITNYVRTIGTQSFTLFPLENCPWERMLTWATHTLTQGRVLGAQHSCIRPTDFRYFDDPRFFADNDTRLLVPDAVIGNGAGACAQWKEAGVPPQILHMGEALRYLYLAESLPDAASNTVPDAESGASILLVATSFFRDETKAHIELFTQALEQGLFKNLQCIIKPHPYLAVTPYLPKHLPPNVTFGDQPIGSYLQAGTLVWASNSTTVALEAALKGLPIAVMQPAGDFDLCPLQDVAELVRTATLEDVHRMLEHPRPLSLPTNYLLLDSKLTQWKRLLAFESDAPYRSCSQLP